MQRMRPVFYPQHNKSRERENAEDQDWAIPNGNGNETKRVTPRIQEILQLNK